MFPFVLYGYRMSVRTSTAAIPFSLVYRMEALLLFEVEIPSLQVLMKTQLEEAGWVQANFDPFNLIVEKRITVVCHETLYKRRMKKCFTKRCIPKNFMKVI